MTTMSHITQRIHATRTYRSVIPTGSECTPGRVALRAFLRLAVVTIGLLLPRPMAAQEDAPVTFTGNVAVKSDHTFRGISQTLEEPAIQGGMNGTGPAGLYVGV